jgi:phosphoribosyl 1,2-cyclic phosphate phosphodiesterase
MHLTVLGSGTSMGVPTLTCHCAVCTSPDPRDNRLRSSVLLEHNGQTAVIDTTPDFRYQALRANLQRLDAIVFTHGHADHILGFDDIRPYNLRQKSSLPVYASPETIKTLKSTFSYIFDTGPAISTIPQVSLHPIVGPFEAAGLHIIPIPAWHGNMEVLGFRFGSAAYLTDFSELPDSSKPLLADLNDLVMDALRDVPHPMHQTVEQALAVVEELKPRRVWFTHIAHELPHVETNQRLIQAGFPQVSLAYDGLRFEVRL